MGDLPAGTSPAVEPERIRPVYEPPPPGAVAKPQPTEPVRPSANARKREAQETLLDALGAVMQQLRRPKEQTVVEAPKLLSMGGLTLVMFAIDIALFMYLLDTVLPPGLSSTLSKILPTILGVAAVAYLEEIRAALFRWSQRRRYRILAAAVPLLWVPLAVPYDVLFISHDPSKLTLVGAKTQRQFDNDSVVTATVRGFRPQVVVVHHTSDDTLELRRRDMFLAAAVRFIPGLSSIRNPYIYAPATVPVDITVGAERGEVRGETVGFPTLHVLTLRKQQLRTTQQGGVTAFVFTARMATQRINIPPGTYDFALRATNCIRERRNVKVEREVTTDVDLDDAPCRNAP